MPEDKDGATYVFQQATCGHAFSTEATYLGDKMTRHEAQTMLNYKGDETKWGRHWRKPYPRALGRLRRYWVPDLQERKGSFGSVA